MKPKFSVLTLQKLNAISDSLYEVIKSHLDVFHEIKFEYEYEDMPLCFLPNENFIKAVKTADGDYVLITSTMEIALNDYACVRVDDLLLIVRAIEDYIEFAEKISSDN